MQIHKYIIIAINILLKVLVVVALILACRFAIVKTLKLTDPIVCIKENIHLTSDIPTMIRNYCKSEADRGFRNSTLLINDTLIECSW